MPFIKTKTTTIAIFALAVAAAVGAAELGRDLTPMGAQAAGNAARTIPAWTGGVTAPVAGYKPGGHYPDPYADDRILFTIDVSNMEQHKDKLSPGQMALLRKYPTWKMNVYPTRRSTAYPKGHYDETAANVGRARLVAGGNGVVGTSGGIPFPMPKNGLEAVWNSLLRYRGDTYAMTWNQAAVTRDGSYTPVRFEYEYDFSYGNLGKSEKEREPNKLTNFLQTVTAPARLAGQILLVHETVDQVTEPRTAWTYNPGQRRVRLAPNVAYDNPGTASDGLRTNDDFQMFNGATDRYEWKLVGKQELYIPYNSYKLTGNALKYKDILRPGHINPEHARYELHRVWVVEATLKQGTSHLYKKRVFYIDEDSWAVAVTDKYDARGELWRVSEQHAINFYDVPMYYGTVEVHHDLQSGRYLAMGLRNEEPVVYQRIKRGPADFTPAGLRRLGVR
ncbi:MAG: outer membrane lipoprotein-sorting protein [Candidatus Muproteobacteria bacterium RBG_16_65_31]|uniref:Outer membrane lipoprotein-sorting protein n=1 Tax=Candidatus Muproteobacteria bacterium RBG_16_65_31 TaxID=1817759 RepID=A0A1F6TBK1_9PROT|nr:MAG: outer membrane lipoprotein-sorting protein [Candidatus Muproteobacteria bacterium RBG_16_65_31]